MGMKEIENTDVLLIKLGYGISVIKILTFLLDLIFKQKKI